ncbi:MAG: hypothetical protein ACREXP_00120 [Steroidobacteraceae bacterium]
MADFGLTKAIGRAVRAGSKGAKVLRPAETELLEREAAAAAKKAPVPEVAAPALDLPEAPAIETPAPTALAEEVIPPPQAPGAPRLAPVEPAAIDQTQVASEAFGMEHASLGDFKLDESYQPNFDTMATTDDVKAVIARQAQANAAKITEARRGVITNEQLKGLAGDLDVSEDVIRKVMERESGGVLNPETILSARQMLISSATRLKDLGTKIAKSQATDLEKVQFARQIQFHNEYQAQFMGARAEAGRSLNAFKIPVGGDAMQIAGISEILKGAGNIEAVARAVSRTNSVSGVTKVVKPGVFKRSARAAQGFINHVFVNGILSGPTTHLVNTLGNVLFQAMNIGETALAARLGRFLPGAEHVEAGEALAMLNGSIGATRDAFRLAGRALKEGETLDGSVKYDVNSPAAPRSVTEHLPGLDKPVIGRVIDGIETGLGLPTRALGAEDDFFKMIAYRGYMEQQTLKHVQEQIANGEASLANAAQVARQTMENPTPEMQAAAEDWARSMTFQSPLGPVGQKAQLFLRSVPALTLIAPFIRTPVNIFKEGVARSPMAALSPRFWNAMKAGGRERDLALTRFAVGSATATYIAHQVAQGNVTGAGPQQPEAKMLWEANGRRPYSVKVGDTWHSYARMEPIASVIGATADVVEINSYLSDDPEVATNEDQEAYKAAGSIIAAIMNNTGNKTFFKGIADFVELTNDPTRNVTSFTNQLGASMVPYSGLQRSIRNVEDPYLREAWTLLDKIRDNTPGYSKDLPLRRGLFAEPREKNSGSILGAMSPFPESKQGYDPVIDELANVMQETRLVPSTMPGKNIDGMRLTAQEYDDYVRIARSEPLFGRVRTYYDELQRTMQSSTYNRATPQGKYELLKAVQNQADAAARAPGGPLEKQNEEYAERIKLWRLEKERFRHGEQ